MIRASDIYRSNRYADRSAAEFGVNSVFPALMSPARDRRCLGKETSCLRSYESEQTTL
jgi:hypothetical protein